MDPIVQITSADVQEKGTGASSHDVVDAGVIDFSEEIPTFLSSPASVSTSRLSAGSLLQLDEVPNKQPAGEVLRQLQPRQHKVDCEISIDDALQDDDNEQFVFTAGGASDAVKHFFGEALAEESDGNDLLDAGPGNASDSDEEETFASVNESFPASHPPPTEAKLFGQRNIDLDKEFRYKTNRPERGCFVIFNHQNFDLYNKDKPKKKHLSVRKGTDRDAENLENTFKQLGFEYVKIFKDSLKSDIIKWIEALSNADHSNYDCFGCAILTHGGEGDILFASDKQMHLDDFTKPFRANRCQSLAGKPKLFFIQACRGNQVDPGHQMTLLSYDQVDAGGDKEDNDEVDGNVEVIIPTEADFLIANSTVEGYYAWRNQGNGSFFIQALCAVFNQYGDQLEVMQLMTRVNKLMAYGFESSGKEKWMNKQKQIPSIATRLTAEVFFPPKEIYQEPQVFSPPPQTSITTTYQRKERHTGSQDFCSETYRTTTLRSFSNRSYADYQQFSGDTPPPLPPKKKHFFPVSKPRKQSGDNSQNVMSIPQSDVSSLPRQEAATPLSIPTVTKNRHLSNHSESYSHSLDDKTRNKDRLTTNRHSLPDTKRLVEQDSKNLIVVAGRKTSQCYVESDV